MSKSFKIKSNFGPSGDQPQAIQKISKGLKSDLILNDLVIIRFFAYNTPHFPR